METLIVVERLEWDAWNREHIQKHGVTEVEVAEAVASATIQRRTYKGRTMIIGPDAKRRILAIVVGPVPGDPGDYYVFSARPASRRERRRYQHNIGAEHGG